MLLRGSKGNKGVRIMLLKPVCRVFATFTILFLFWYFNYQRYDVELVGFLYAGIISLLIFVALLFAIIKRSKKEQ